MDTDIKENVDPPEDPQQKSETIHTGPQNRQSGGNSDLLPVLEELVHRGKSHWCYRLRGLPV